MPRVTIEPAEKGFLVLIDGVGEFLVPPGEAALPRDGQMLTEEEVTGLLAAMTKTAMEFGAKMLAMRLMSRGMLEKRMAQAGYDREIIRLAADKFEELGAIDDSEYARLFAADRSARGWGEVRIAGELRRRALGEDIIREALSELDNPSAEIERFIRQRTGGGQVGRKKADKIGAALIRKGFRWEDIRPVLRTYTLSE